MHHFDLFIYLFIEQNTIKFNNENKESHSWCLSHEIKLAKERQNSC